MKSQRRNVVLATIGFLSWWLYVALMWLSRGFAYGTPGIERPLLAVLLLFAAVVSLYLGAVFCILRHGVDDSAVPLIAVFTFAFRILLLFSEPIQEVDAYRYLWDGKAVTAGVNPYRYSPAQVMSATASENAPAELSRLVKIRDQSAANAVVLSRVHYPQLTTVYPPVSQLVFATVAAATPASATVQTHLLIIKSFIVAFDLGTFWMVLCLLKHVGQPQKLAIIYGWCPLVLKEFANSGHLDSIAVFLTTAASFFAVKALFPSKTTTADGAVLHYASQRRNIVFAALLLWLAVGAKIYPVILLPLFVVTIWKKVSWRAASAVLTSLIVLIPILIAPMLFREPPTPTPTAVSSMVPFEPPLPELPLPELPLPELVQSEPPLPTTITASPMVPLEPPLPELPSEPPLPGPPLPELSRPESHSPVSPVVRQPPGIDDQQTGLAAFTLQWQMNDFLFLLLFENFKPPTNSPSLPLEAADLATSKLPVREPWFVVTSSAVRNRFADTVSSLTEIPGHRVAFQIARLLTTGIFGLIALWLTHKVCDTRDAATWLEAIFLTIAWFWMLQPTQNPWYWTWAMPFVMFCRSRVWLLMSGLTLIYYARFWFDYHSHTPVAGTPYSGVDFFDYVMTWIEFFPFLMLVIAERVLPRRH